MSDVIVLVWDDPTGNQEDLRLLGLVHARSVEHVEWLLGAWGESSIQDRERYGCDVLLYLLAHECRGVLHEEVTVQGRGADG